MARPVTVKGTGKGERSGGKKHLNASLPRQLVFDFNAAASKQGPGRRDALLEELLRRFLERVEPNSRSLRRRPTHENVDSRGTDVLTETQAASVRRRASEATAIRAAREHAAAILEITAEFERKPPRRAPVRKASAKRKAS
jgi:hypothetical protein